MFAKTSNKKGSAERLSLHTWLLVLLATLTQLSVAQTTTSTTAEPKNPSEAHFKKIPLSIVTADDTYRFSVEIANTDELRQKGLMWRQHLQPNEGMLFIYNDSKTRNFWMKNTLIPLDIIFINKEGIIVNISAGKPLSLKHIRSKFPVKYVLELQHGKSALHNISSGDRLNTLELKNSLQLISP